MFLQKKYATVIKLITKKLKRLQIRYIIFCKYVNYDNVISVAQILSRLKLCTTTPCQKSNEHFEIRYKIITHEDTRHFFSHWQNLQKYRATNKPPGRD